MRLEIAKEARRVSSQKIRVHRVPVRVFYVTTGAARKLINRQIYNNENPERWNLPPCFCTEYSICLVEHLANLSGTLYRCTSWVRKESIQLQISSKMNTPGDPNHAWRLGRWGLQCLNYEPANVIIMHPIFLRMKHGTSKSNFLHRIQISQQQNIQYCKERIPDR